MYHERAFVVAGLFAGASILVSARLIYKHFENWSNPRIQRKIVAILWMVPIYATISWLSLRFKDSAVYLDMIRDTYEAYVIYLFLALMIAYLSEGQEYRVVDILDDMRGHLTHPFPFNYVFNPIQLDASFLRRCKFGVMQFVVVKPFMTLIAVFLEIQGLYEKGEFRVDRGYAYVAFIQNVSITYAFYDLVLFYVALKTHLKPYDPVPKFLAIKAVLFLSFWQGVFLAALAQFGWIDEIGSWTVENVSTGVQNWLICIEMALSALGHWYAFPYTPFLTESSRATDLRTTFLNDNLAIDDAVNDFNDVAPGRVLLPSNFKPGRPKIVHFSNLSQQTEQNRQGTGEFGSESLQQWLSRDANLSTNLQMDMSDAQNDTVANESQDRTVN